jgi:hypothetical protein
MWYYLFDFHAGLDELIERVKGEDRDRAAMHAYYDGLNDPESWSVDNPSTRIFTLVVDNVEIEIRYKRDQYWNRDSDYYNAWDAYFIENLPKALDAALHSFVVESAMVVNRTLGYSMGQDGAYRDDPRNPDEQDIKWINDGQRENLEERMGIRKASQRGGQRRLDWPTDRQLHFLEVYEAVYKSIRDAAGRVCHRDPLPLRVAALRAANDVLPEGERLPGDIIEKIAVRVDQKAAPTLQELAIETAACKLNTDTNSYLIKILTKARKIRDRKEDTLAS